MCADDFGHGAGILLGVEGGLKEWRPAVARSRDPMQGGADLGELLGRLARGDDAALSPLYRLTSAKLYGVVVGILGRGGEAEDTLQEVYVAIWREAARYDASRSRPMTWMITIARNRAIDRIRRAGRRPAAGPLDDVDPPDPAPTALDELEQSQSAARLERCLEELGAEQARCIRLAYLGGYSHAELAERLGAPLGTVKSWVRRSLVRLRECLER